MVKDIYRTITKKHSTTFYYASLFFPKKIREDVYKLYAFLRTADDLVDEARDKKSFLVFKKETYQALNKNYSAKNSIISAFVQLYRQYDFSKEYLDSFFFSLESDFTVPLKLKNKKELAKYIYGVAGVVGLMMAKIMKLPKKFYFAAKDFGELMQLVNIIRDIKEDYQKGRVYIPKEEIKRYGLVSVADSNFSGFNKLIKFEIGQILVRMQKLGKEIGKIPLAYRRPVKIAQAVYLSIAQKIYQQPLLVWQKRVSLSKPEMFFLILKNLF